MILSQGAEAIIRREGDKVFKERTAKSYRLKELDDSMRRSRTKREIKVIQKAAELDVCVPKLFLDELPDKYTVVMSFVNGKRLRDYLLENPDASKLTIVGQWLAKLHEATIIHGDLTTSNILINENGEMTLIDFGLSFFSTKIEDMAVDVHLLEQAIESTHYEHAKEFFAAFLKGYAIFNQSDDVLKRLEVVRARGRNKH